MDRIKLIAYCFIYLFVNDLIFFGDVLLRLHLRPSGFNLNWMPCHQGVSAPLIKFIFWKKLCCNKFLPSVVRFFIFTLLKLVLFCEYTSVTVFCVFMIVSGVVYVVIWYWFSMLPKTVESWQLSHVSPALLVHKNRELTWVLVGMMFMKH